MAQLMCVSGGNWGDEREKSAKEPEGKILDQIRQLCSYYLKNIYFFV